MDNRQLLFRIDDSLIKLQVFILVSRRQVLHGVLSTHREQFFPPWSINSEQFIETCTRCDDCIEICPQHILKKNEQGFPVVNYTEAGCTFCTECANVCKTDSLSLMEFIGAEPWNVKAVITKFCVNYNGTICQMCASGCQYGAIKFRVHSGNMTLPEIDLEACNGCGDCYRSCPKLAIDIKQLQGL